MTEEEYIEVPRLEDQPIMASRPPAPPVASQITHTVELTGVPDGLVKRLGLTVAATRAAWFANQQQTLSILADCERALKRAIKRADTLPAEFERIEVKQHRGATLEFTARKLAGSAFEAGGREAMSVEFEIWETRAGALVAITATEPLDRDGIELVRATVVEPGGDEQARHFAVMEHFEWSDYARSMARKLGWDLRQEVE